MCCFAALKKKLQLEAVLQPHRELLTEQITDNCSLTKQITDNCSLTKQITVRASNCFVSIGENC